MSIVSSDPLLVLNRQSVTENGVVTNYVTNAMNQLTNLNGQAIGYDGNFNYASIGGWQFGYDAERHLTSLTNAGPRASFVYDGLGRCVKRTIEGGTTLITYDGWNPILEWDQAGNWKAVNVYGAKADEILLRVTAANGPMSFKRDRRGNVSFVLGSSTQIIEKYSYDAFGKPTIMNGSGVVNTDSHAVSAVGNRFMFQGREYFGELGLMDFRHRIYAPTLGRFLQADPTGFDGGDMNLFRYCADDPVDNTDPTGLAGVGLTSWGKGAWVTGSDGMTYEDRWRMGDNRGSVPHDQPPGMDGGFTMAGQHRSGGAEKGQGGVRRGDGYGASPVEAGLQREGDAKKIARGDTEGVTEIGHDKTNPGQFYSPPAHGGNKEVSNFKDDVKKDNAPVATSVIDSSHLPRNYKLVGGVVAYRLFSSSRAAEDIQRAKNHGWRTFIMTAPERKVPVIYDKYTSPNPVF